MTRLRDAADVNADVNADVRNEIASKGYCLFAIGLTLDALKPAKPQ